MRQPVDNLQPPGLRIGLITGEYPPRQGGVGDFTRELARALATLGHAAHVITRRDSRPELLEEGVTVHRIISSWGWRCWRPIASVAQQHDLAVLNIQYEPAAYAMQVGINLLPGRIARAWVKRPIVTTFHDLLVPYLFPKAGPLRRKIVDYLARHSDAVIATNEEDRARLARLELSASNLQLIPIGSNVDPARMGEFDPVAERARWQVQPGESLIGYFGFLNLSKGGEVLVPALKALIEAGVRAKLLLIGGRTGASDPTNAAYAAQVERLIASLDLKDRVTATGYLDSAGVSRALMACDVCALPYLDGASLRRGSLLAAIAHGRAIVTTLPLFPIDGLTHNESALFVPPNDPAALAAAIRQVLIDSDLRGRLERGARTAARLYTWDRIAARTVEIYQSVRR